MTKAPCAPSPDAGSRWATAQCGCGSFLSSYVQRGKAACEIGLQVFKVLEPHGHSDHALRDARGLALFLGEPAVRGARRVGDRGLGVAKIGGDRADARAVDHVEGRTSRR